MTDKRLDAQDRSALGLIERLSNAPGAPGFEDDVLAVLRDAAGPASAVTEDSVRNLYIRGEGLGGNGPVVMLDAHTDEVAFMVQAIKPNGTLRFVPLGGFRVVVGEDQGVAAQFRRVGEGVGDDHRGG